MNAESDYSVRPAHTAREVAGLTHIQQHHGGLKRRTSGRKDPKRRCDDEQEPEPAPADEGEQAERAPVPKDPADDKNDPHSVDYLA